MVKIPAGHCIVARAHNRKDASVMLCVVASCETVFCCHYICSVQFNCEVVPDRSPDVRWHCGISSCRLGDKTLHEVVLVLMRCVLFL